MEFIAEIARGGFGVVSKVRYNNEICACKTFAPSVPLTFDQMNKFRKRFIQEVNYQNSLPPQFVMQIIHSELYIDPPYFIMPLSEMNFCQRIIEARNNDEDLLDELSDILNALEVLHGYGLVHRDLKPENILRHDGHWKISDFGLILNIDTDDYRLTSTLSAWGSSRYAAPEQCYSFHCLDHRADIYAFGCILHDIYVNTSRIPYKTYTYSGAIGRVIEICTEEAPEKRFQDISKLREALTLALREDINIPKTKLAKPWIVELEHLKEWPNEQLHEFCHFIYDEANNGQVVSEIFYSLTEKEFDIIYNWHNCNMWKSIVIRYCDWVSSDGFEFSYCDILIDRLYNIYNNYCFDDLDMKSRICIATSILGSQHNRWYVMTHLIKMCGVNIEYNLASRIAIDICAFGLHRYFMNSAKAIQTSIVNYHSCIYQVLNEYENRCMK